MRYFIGADIEAPYLSFYATIDDDPHFSGRWTWADENGMPQKGEGVIYCDNFQDAQNAVGELKESGGGISPPRETIQWVPRKVTAEERGGERVT